MTAPTLPAALERLRDPVIHEAIRAAREATATWNRGEPGETCLPLETDPDDGPGTRRAVIMYSDGDVLAECSSNAAHLVCADEVAKALATAANTAGILADAADLALNALPALVAFVERVAEVSDPIIGTGGVEGGSYECRFCGEPTAHAGTSWTEARHAAICPWTEARHLLGREAEAERKE